MPNVKPVTLIIPASATDLAYIAGIIDGEGCISFSRSNRRWSISIASTDQRLIEWIHRMGGSVAGTDASWLGKKTVWQWSTVSQRNVLALLQAVEPYMIIKREKAAMTICEIEAWLEKPQMCRNGLHELEETSHEYPSSHRRCSICKNEANRRYRERRKETVPS